MASLPVEISTNSLKRKYKAQKSATKLLRQSLKRKEIQCEKYRQSIASLKKQLREYEKGKAVPVIAGGASLGLRPSGYFYPAMVIRLCISYQVHLGLSYRQTSSAVSEMYAMLGISLRAPCWSTVRQWVLKQGYFNLHTQNGAESEGSVLIIDESASIGKEKALAILEVSPCRVPDGKALGFSDTDVVFLGSKPSWKSGEVAEKLQEAADMLPSPILYVISDRDSTLCKAINESALTQVVDCTHWMANCVERYYKKLEDYLAFQSHLGRVRQKLVNGRHVGMIAPNMRTKARFLNLYEITGWLKKVLFHWESLDEEQCGILSFIKAHEALAQELIAIIELVRQLSKLLKSNGVTPKSKQRIQEIFKEAPLKSPTIMRFQADMETYVDTIREKLPCFERVLCCSDVIESYFGKFKYRGNKAASQGITNDLLSVAIFNNKLSSQQALNAMEAVTWEKVKLWTHENMTISFAQSKHLFWKKMAS